MLFVKSLHIIAIISWMAGLLYLPRLFVYHAQFPDQGPIFFQMERRLYRFIMMPALILAVLSGGYLFSFVDFYSYWWIITKLTSVLLLIAFHFYLGHQINRASVKKLAHSSRFFRIINEIPTVLMIIIVFSVVFQF
jgi:putative membrane protein